MNPLDSPLMNSDFVKTKMNEKGWDVFYEDDTLIRFLGKNLDGRSCTVTFDKKKKIYIGFSIKEPVVSDLVWPSISFGD